jgi:hypothetical protein
MSDILEEALRDYLREAGPVTGTGVCIEEVQRAGVMLFRGGGLHRAPEPRLGKRGPSTPMLIISSERRSSLSPPI